MLDFIPKTILKDLQLDELPEDEKAVLTENIAGVVFQGTMLRVFELLSEPQLEELGKLFEASSTDSEDAEKKEAIYNFLKSNVPTLDTIVTEEILVLKNEFNKQSP